MSWCQGGSRVTLGVACALAVAGGGCNADSAESTPRSASTGSTASTTTTTTAAPPEGSTSSAPRVPSPDPPDLKAPLPGQAITSAGAGDVRLGQVLEPSAVTQYESPGSCGYWGPIEPSHGGDEPLGGLVAGANTATPTVRSIVIRSNASYRTASGVGVGTRLATLQRIYGDDLVLDRMDGWDRPTAGLLGSYNDVAAVRHGGGALTFVLMSDLVTAIKVSAADFWGDDEGCA